jgi:hypothetical protein
MRISLQVSLGVLLACGALAGWLLGSVVPDGLVAQVRREVVTQPFHLSRVVDVTEGHWFFLPQLWGDFDLQMDLELGEGVEVDVLLRQVEPRFVDEVQLPFAGRFAALRVSTEGDGAGWRTRDEALFGPKGGGVGVEPGLPSTVWIEARGGTLTANVGGKRQAAFEADDVYGMFAVLARGGKAVIHRLDIQARAVPDLWLWRRWTWLGFGVAAALVVAAFTALLSRQRPFAAAGGAMLGLTASLVHGVELDLMFPDVAGMVVLLAAPAAVAVLVGALRGRALTAATLLVAAAVVTLWSFEERVAPAVARTLGAVDSGAVDAVFGPDAGEQPSRALGMLVRQPNGLVDPEKRGRRAFLLGGEWLYNRGEPGEHVGLQLAALLGGAFGAGADAPSLPTVDGHSSQQWRLFDGFFQGFAPDVLVFGVGASEAAVDDAGGAPRSTPERFAETLRQVREDCRRRGRALVLFADVGTPRAFREQLRAAASEDVPLVELTDEIPRPEVARRLFAAIRPLLR